MMNLDELLSMTPSELEHHGVKGQKWGVRRAGSAGVKAIKSASKAVGDEAKLRGNSVKRELGWQFKNPNTMSTKKLAATAKRVNLENQLKRHARGRIVNPLQKGSYAAVRKTKRDYLNRSKMSTKDLQAKVRRLDLERELRKSAKSATKSQKDLAASIMKSMATDPTPTGVATGILKDQVGSYINDRRKYNN